MNINDCDLEEVKHIALQKFLELAEHPEQWTSSSYYPFNTYTLGKFKIRHYYGSPGCKSHYNVEINYQSIWDFYSKDSVPTQGDPIFAGIKKIVDFDNKRRCDEQKEAILKATRESCLTIQKALEDPMYPPTNLYDVVVVPPRKRFWQRFFCD